MKQRLLVLNGTRLLQNEQEGQWKTDNVVKAGPLKPGVYNIHTAGIPDRSKVSEGTIIHVDKTHVFQQVRKDVFVKHERSVFDKVPEVGDNCSINYQGNKAVVASGQKLGRGLSR